MNVDDRTERVRPVDSELEHGWRFDPPSAVEQERVAAAAVDPYERRRALAARLLDALYLVFGIVIGLIAIRFVLKALGANPAAEFADLVYRATAPLLGPFVGLFPPLRLDGSVIEPESIVAMIVYALVAWVLGRVVWIALGEPRAGEVSRREIERTIR